MRVFFSTISIYIRLTPLLILLRAQEDKFIETRWLSRKHVGDLNTRNSWQGASIDCRLIRLAIVNLVDNGHTTVSNAIARPGHGAATIAAAIKRSRGSGGKGREKEGGGEERKRQ